MGDEVGIAEDLQVRGGGMPLSQNAWGIHGLHADVIKGFLVHEGGKHQSRSELDKLDHHDGEILQNHG